MLVELAQEAADDGSLGLRRFLRIVALYGHYAGLAVLRSACGKELLPEEADHQEGDGKALMIRRPERELEVEELQQTVAVAQPEELAWIVDVEGLGQGLEQLRFFG